MSNYVRIELETIPKRMVIQDDKILVDDKEDLYWNGPKDEVTVYVSCDQLKCWVGTCEPNVDSLNELVSPENLKETLVETLSEYEYNMISTILRCSNNKYLLGGKWLVAE